jgi:hypothetical protein
MSVKKRKSAITILQHPRDPRRRPRLTVPPDPNRGESPKLQPPWESPYKVNTLIIDIVYKIHRRPMKKQKVVHLTDQQFTQNFNYGFNAPLVLSGKSRKEIGCEEDR